MKFIKIQDKNLLDKINRNWDVFTDICEVNLNKKYGGVMKLIEDNYTNKRVYILTCPHCKSCYTANHQEVLVDQECTLCYWSGRMDKKEISDILIED